MKLVQTRWKWKCQWRISGLARKQNAEKSRRQLQGGVDVSRSEPAGPQSHFCVFGYVTPKSMTRLRTFQDIQPRRYDIQRDALSQCSKKGLVCNHAAMLAPPRKMTRKCCAVDPPASVCAVRAYLRCNRSVDENFLPGIRGTVNATALGSA